MSWQVNSKHWLSNTENVQNFFAFTVTLANNTFIMAFIKINAEGQTRFTSKDKFNVSCMKYVKYKNFQYETLHNK